jgi:hypothetical protein
LIGGCVVALLLLVSIVATVVGSRQKWSKDKRKRTPINFAIKIAIFLKTIIAKNVYQFLVKIYLKSEHWPVEGWSQFFKTKQKLFFF